MRKSAVGKISWKPYQCKGCDNEQEEKTNHWGEIYQYCSICLRITTWQCNEVVPKGYEKPSRWKIY